jgi:beta-galactosidase
VITLKNKRIYIDQKPVLIMSGEIHYYRLAKADWQDRIDKLKQAGLNCVATYIPWICHETEKGCYDFTGLYREEHDLAGFLDLCTANGLYVFVRPGPFIMAEMKNEGLPFWLYEKYPEIIPVTWDSNAIATRTVDYLAPSFLEEVKNWYSAVMKIIVPRLYTNGGKIIGIQLDNEIGMLSWVSNCPDLTDPLLSDFSEWLKRRYPDTMEVRYPFELSDRELAKAKFRSPEEEYSLPYLHDLGCYMRHRFSRYVSELKSHAEECGVSGVPFIVNIHGTGGGRGFTFPIGISQLYESYSGISNMMSGTDIYLGDLTMLNFEDLYIINALTDACNSHDQPLSSVEFECGDGNYNDGYGQRYDISASDFKARMCIAQGNRLINYYLFTGGYNYRFSKSVGDWNDRIAFTGEHHGFAAPVGPTGKLNYTFRRMAEGIQSIMAVSDKLADMDEEHDPVSFGFIPDYYMTEYYYPKSEKMKAFKQNLEANRTYEAWEVTARAMLLLGYRFNAIDVQNNKTNSTETRVLVLPSAKYMHGHVQQKLVDYLLSGGKLLLLGELPDSDMEGESCTILLDALGVTLKGRYSNNKLFHHLTVTPVGAASDNKEITTGFAQTVEGSDISPLINVYGTNEPCAFEKKVGSGHLVAVTTPFHCNLNFYQLVFTHLSMSPGLSHDCEEVGLFMTSTANKNRERFVHILNLDGFDKEFRVYEAGIPLFDGSRISLPAKQGMMLPLNLNLNNGIRIVSSTVELTAYDTESLTFRLTGSHGMVVLDSTRDIKPSPYFTSCKKNGHVIVALSEKTSVMKNMTIVFAS